MRPARMWAIAAVSADTPEMPMFAPAPAAGFVATRHDQRQPDVPEHEPDSATRDRDEEAPRGDERELHVEDANARRSILEPMPQTPALRPRWRGVSHLSMFPVAAGLRDSARVRRTTATRRSSRRSCSASAVTAMFAVSGFYHVITWQPAVRRWLARLDHATVYGLIAATYTPFGLLVLDGAWQVTMLAIVWSGAAVAILVKLFWVGAPKWLSASIALALGWASVAAMPEIARDESASAACSSSQPAGCSTRPARSCTRYAVRIRRRASSDTTSCSTRS